MFLAVGSGFLARAGMHYSDAAESDAISQEVYACPGCVSSDQVMDAYAESFRVKIQDSLQDMILTQESGSRSFRWARVFL